MFQPTDVSGCLFWLKADDIIANSSNYVTGWPNAGYKTCDFNQKPESDNPNLLNRNILQPHSLNNHATVQFLEGGGLSTGIITDLPRTDYITTFYLFKQNIVSVGANQQYLFRGPERTTITDSIHVFYSTLQLGSLWTFSTDYNSNHTFLGYLKDWIIRSDVVDDSLVTFRRNGFALASGFIATPLPDISAPPFNGEGECIVGGSIGPGSGELAEVLIYDNRLAEEDIVKIENYLKYKYFVNGVAAHPTFIHGCSTGTSGQYHPSTPLFIESVPSSGTTPLYIAQAYTVSSGTPLYTAGVPHQEGTIPLYMGESEVTSSSGTLYILGSTPNDSGVTLYTQSADSNNDDVTLFIMAAPMSTGTPPLYIHGRTIANSEDFPLYIQGLQNLSSNNNTALFIATNTSSANSGVYNFYDSVSLNIYSSSPGGYLNLFVESDIQGENDGYMPLFIDNHPQDVHSNAELFIQNNNAAFSNQARMFVRGLGGLDGGLIKNDNMNLYIERWPSSGMTFFMNSAIVPSSTSLYTCSANSINNNVNLMMSGGQQLIGTGNIPFYVDAGFIKDNSIDMYTHGLPNIGENSTIYTNGF